MLISRNKTASLKFNLSKSDFLVLDIKVFLNLLEPDFLLFRNYFNNVDSQNIIRSKRFGLGENIIIGLYNDINNNYTFVKNSQYDGLTNMFIIFI